jgi:hypothetical protein
LEGSCLNILVFSTHIWFSMTTFTFNRLLSGKTYQSFYKERSLTPLIRASKAIDSINSSISSISSLNLFKYTLMDFLPDWVTLKSSMELLLTSISVLNYDTSLTHSSLEPMIEPDLMLLYQAYYDPLKFIMRILHITSPSWMTNLRLLTCCGRVLMDMSDHCSCSKSSLWRLTLSIWGCAKLV